MKDKSEFSNNVAKDVDTQQAVVIGCSHNNKDCGHEIHPNSKNFYTIDLMKHLNPDHSMDIVNDEVPDSLKNKFKLTILENLPYQTYNHSVSMMHKTGNSGKNGLDNIRKLTHEDGFILVIGSSRDYNFRNGLAHLNYLEIAKDEDDWCVLLIPNNQKLSIEEINQRRSALPNSLQNSIYTAANRIGYKPLHTTEFCKTNYRVSVQNKAFITDLSKYLSDRIYRGECKINFEIFGREFNFGYSRKEKMDATNALIHVLLGNKPPESLAKHKGALSDGTLGSIVHNHLKGQPIQNLLDAQPHNDLDTPPNSMNNSHSLSSRESKQEDNNLFEENSFFKQ